MLRVLLVGYLLLYLYWHAIYCYPLLACNLLLSSIGMQSTTILLIESEACNLVQKITCDWLSNCMRLTQKAGWDWSKLSAFHKFTCNWLSTACDRSLSHVTFELISGSERKLSTASGTWCSFFGWVGQICDDGHILIPHQVYTLGACRNTPIRPSPSIYQSDPFTKQSDPLTNQTSSPIRPLHQSDP